MKLAIVGSRALTCIDISPHVPDGVIEIISGGAIGVDTLAQIYADTHRIPKHIIRPQYDKYPAKLAPLMRNELIALRCDSLLAFWDGKSRGTLHIINLARALGKPVTMITP